MIMHHFANHHNAISLPYLICRQLCDRAIHNPYKYIRTHVRNTYVVRYLTYATVAAAYCGGGCDLDRARICRYSLPYC